MRTILVLVVAMAGCGESEPTPCEKDVSAFYKAGCFFARPDGSRIDEAELGERCEQHIAESDGTCTMRPQEFAACLGGLSVVCQ